VISGLWYEAVISEGTILHVVSEIPSDLEPIPSKDERGLPVVRVDEERNFLIVNPDTFVSPSAVLSAVECDRRYLH